MATFKTPAVPCRRERGPVAVGPILTSVWRIGADGRLIRRWRATSR
jgi:hypothetical protein